jgi:hypothetical protein
MHKISSWHRLHFNGVETTAKREESEKRGETLRRKKRKIVVFYYFMNIYNEIFYLSLSIEHLAWNKATRIVGSRTRNL